MEVANECDPVAVWINNGGQSLTLATCFNRAGRQASCSEFTEVSVKIVNSEVEEG